MEKNRAVAVQVYQAINANLRKQEALLIDLETMDGTPFYRRGEHYRSRYVALLDKLDDLNIELAKLKRMVSIA